MRARSWRILESGWFLAGAILIFSGFMGLVLVPYSSRAAGYTPEGGGFDTTLIYTPREALDRAAAFNQAGRLAYIADRWTLDLAWPVVYGTLLASAAAFALRRLGPVPGGLTRSAWALVLAGPALDYAENIAATVLTASVPGRPWGWAVAASVFTPAKWTAITLSVLALLGLYATVAARGLRTLRRKR